MKKSVLYTLLITAVLLVMLSFTAAAANGAGDDLQVAANATVCSFRGDVNADGKVTSEDARLIMRYSVGLENFTQSQLLAGDLDNDSQVNSADARTALRISVNLEKQPMHVSTEIVTKEATCTEDGAKQKVCKYCGCVYSSTVISASGHMGGTWEITEKSTCLTQGKAVRNCIYCGKEVASKELPLSGHTYGKWVTEKEASCLDYGTKYKQCSVCGEKTYETIKATGHSFHWIDTIEATCTTDGEKTLTCTGCGLTNGTVKVLCTGHIKPYSYTVTQRPTCKEAGVESRACLICGEILESRAVPATGHSYNSASYSVIKAATCSEAGKAVAICTICGERYDITLEKLPHTLTTDWTETVAPTCTENGIKNAVCSVCGEVTETIPMLGHSYSWVVTKAATCADYGTEDYVCANCDDVLETHKTQPLGHKLYGDVVVTKQATCSAKGEGYRYCSVCREKVYGTTPIISTNHAASSEATVLSEATCTIPEEYGFCCIYCGTVVRGPYYKSGTQLGHEWSEASKTTPATCTQDGYIGKVCIRCGKVDASATVIPATGHTEGDWEVLTPAICTAEGVKVKKCTVCSEVLETGVIKTAEHTPGEWTVTKAPTLTEKGEKEQRCTVCGEVIKTVEFFRVDTTYCAFTVTFDERNEIEPGTPFRFTVDNGGKDIEVRYSFGKEESYILMPFNGVYSFPIPDSLTESDTLYIIVIEK